jgi:hypothetical protein
MRIADRCVVCGSTQFVHHPAKLAAFIAHRVFPQRPVYSVGEVLARARPFRFFRFLMPLLRRLSFWRKPFPVLIGALHCLDCGLLFSDLRLDSQELGRIYYDYRGPDYVKDRDYFEPGYAHANPLLGDVEEIAVRNANLEGVLNKACVPTEQVTAVLDYGGDEGQFIPASLAMARRIVYEVSDKTPCAGVEKVSTLDGLPPVEFAMVCHVLEHVSEPAEILTRVKHAIRPGGYIYVEVPMEMVGLDMPETLKPGIVGFHEHINFFCTRSVGRLLEESGFSVIFNETIGLSIHGNTAKVVSAIGRLPN